MSTRIIQITQLEQKIERLQVQLDYLRRLDELDAKQSSVVSEKTEDQ